MTLFTEFEESSAESVKMRLDDLYGKAKVDEQMLSYFDVFNHDCKFINQLLNETTQETLFQQKAYESQEDYNNALSIAKQRWGVSDKEYHSGVLMIKDLSARKKIYEQNLADMNAYESKMQLLKSYSHVSEPFDTEKSPWTRLKALVSANDQSKLAKLEEIQQAWLGQGILSKGNTRDILKLMHELDNMKAMLDFLSSKINPNSLLVTDKNILNLITSNRHTLATIEQQCFNALGWRIRAATLCNNLRCDDALLGLIKDLQGIVLNEIPQDQLAQISDLVELPAHTKTFEMEFDNFAQALQIVQQATDKHWYHQWLSARWVTNPDNKNLIEVVVQDDLVVPAKLAHLIPHQSSYKPDSWARYWFFRVNQYSQGFWGWLKRKFLGDYNETITFINESHRQATQFEMLLQAYKSQGYGLNLNYISDSPAFMAALSLPRMLNNESRRGERARPSWLSGYLFSFVPFLNRFASYQFFSLWREQVSDARRTIALKYRNIAKIIVEDYERLMLSSITSKSFTFYKGLIDDLEKFIRIYGEQEDIRKFNSISDPIFILQKFDFLLNEKAEENHRTLNEDALISFMNFAQRYWSNEKVDAIKALVNIINRSEVPANSIDDAALMLKVNCLLNKDDKQQSFAQLMNLIATKYLFETGDDGTASVYEFLRRYAPQAFENWKTNRQMAIEEKFILINKILLDGQKKELALESSEIYEVGALQLFYNKYASYINDIKQADIVNKTQNESALVKQARQYIKLYKGDNALYADLLVKLLLPEQIPLLIEYVTKRFSFLMKGHKQENERIDYADYEFVRYLSQHPIIMDSLASLIQNEYQGDNLELAEIVLSMNNAKLNAIYFGKYFSTLLNLGNYKQLLQDKDNFNQYCSSDDFNKITSAALSKVVEECIQNENWKKCESDEFHNLIETFGSLENKENYRLQRITRLLKKSNSDETKTYLCEVSRKLNGKLEDTLFTLPHMKKALDDTLALQVKQLLQNEQWEGHTQYFLEFFLSSASKDLLYDMRIQWLCDYLAHPKKFADENALERSYMEAKYHYQNKDVPNEEVSLETFYGKPNARRIKEVIIGFLEKIESPLTDEQMALIRRYLKDPMFALDGKGPFYCKKFEIYQKMLKILHMINEGDYQGAVKFCELFVDEIHGLEELNALNQSADREEVINYDKKMLSMVVVALQKKYRELIVTKDVLDAQVIDQPIIMKKIDNERSSLKRIILESGLTQELKKAIQDMSEKEERAAVRAVNFANKLNFKTLHLINLNADVAYLFKNYLSESAKAYISKRIDIVKAYLSENDMLHAGLCAYQRIMESNSDEKDKQNDIELIERYRAKQRDYALMADNVALKLIATLDEGAPLTKCSLFNELKGSYQSAFIHDISVLTKKSLIRALELRIERMILQNDNVTLSDRSDWQKHGKLLGWLATSNTKEEKGAREKVQNLVKVSLEEAKKSLLTLIDKYDNVFLNKKEANKNILEASTYLPSQEVLQQEKTLLKQGLFIRSFGDDLQKKTLDRLLAEVAKRQRKVMMNALNGPFVEHCLDYADTLLTLSGSGKQRVECIHLIDAWNRYRGVNMADVRSVAIENAIPQYINDFDNAIFQYFIKKHDLNENFTQLMLDKIDKWQLTDELIEPNQLLKSHPIAEFKQILVEQAQKVKHGMFYSGPSNNDAEKLFVSFCLALQAHQLANIWEKRLSQNPKGLRSFKPDDISEPLSSMVKTLSKKFDIGRNQFNESISRAIHKDKESFASWSAIETPENLSTQTKQKLVQ